MSNIKVNIIQKIKIKSKRIMMDNIKNTNTKIIILGHIFQRTSINRQGKNIKQINIIKNIIIINIRKTTTNREGKIKEDPIIINEKATYIKANIVILKPRIIIMKIKVTDIDKTADKDILSNTKALLNKSIIKIM